MCPETSKKAETEEKKTEMTNTQHLTEIIKQLQEEVENLRLELKEARSIPSEKIGFVFAVPGILALVAAVLNNSNILAFIGLGLTFWGALFFFVRPIKYVKSSLLDSAAISTYTTVDRIVRDLKLKGKSYYIPPYPKEVYLPEYLKGLKEPVIFISAGSSSMPSIEELAKSKFLLENPNGICIAPPGLGLLTEFENELRKDMTEFQLSELCESLPPVIVESLQLAKEMEIRPDDNGVYIKMFDSVYKNLYRAKENLLSVNFLGCPIVSAVACAIAKATGKVVTIRKTNVSPDNQTIEVWYNFLEA